MPARTTIEPTTPGPNLLEVTEKTVVFDLQGLNCGACVGRVQRALDGAHGVAAARVNLANKTAVTTLLADTTPEQIAETITNAGYPATQRASHGAAPKPQNDSARYRQAFWLAALLALPVFVLEMGAHLFAPFHHFIGSNLGHDTSRIIQFALTALVLAGPGRQFFRIGIPALLRGAPEMNALVAMGTGAAFGFSTVATFAPQMFPAGTAHVYFEAAAVIVVLILLGRWLEARAKQRAGAAIARLANLTPQTALLDKDGHPTPVPLAAVVAGDILHVRPGDRIPADGKVIQGHAVIDQSMLTGEPVPVAVSCGDAVTGGTLNGTTVFQMQVEKTGAQTVLARIIRMVETAQGARLPVENLVDRVTRFFVPVVLVLAALTAVGWLSFGPQPALGHAVVVGVSVLIIACPCAMGLAVPVSIMVATGRGAELGILLRRGDAFQRLAEVKTVCFDKTGTLTSGQMTCTDVVTVSGWEADDMLTQVAAAEAASEHPLARAVVAEAASRGLKWPPASEVETLPGLGLRAVVEGGDVLIGNAALMARETVCFEALESEQRALFQSGATVLFVARAGQAVGLVGISDQPRAQSAFAVDALKAAGVKVVMITGDAQAPAEALASQLGISEFYAGTLPVEKAQIVARLKALGPVAFVGDGINDAPALAAADVGLAIGSGSAIATESGDIVLARSDPGAVIAARQLSRATMTNIRQNLAWAFGYNVLLIPVAMGALYPFTGQLLSPAFGAGAMALSSVFVVSNALRLRRVGNAGS